MKRYIACTLVLCIMLSSLQIAAKLQGQARVDSLIKELAGPYRDKEDTDKVKLLYELSFGYYLINPDEGLKYAQQSLELARKLNWDAGIGWSHVRFGSNYYTKAAYPAALEHFGEGLKVFEAIKDEKGMSAALGNIGLIYERLSDFAKALEYDMKSLKLAEKTGDKTRIAINLGNIGIVFWDESKYQEALDYQLRAMKIYEELGDAPGMAACLGSQGNIYDDMGEYQKSLDVYFKALELSKKAGLKKRVATETVNIANVYIYLHKYDEALKYFFEALRLNTELGSKIGMAISYGGIGNLYMSRASDTLQAIAENNALSKSDLHRAKLYLDSAIAIDEEIKSLDHWLTDVHNLSKTDALLQDYKKAYEDHLLYTKLKDSIFSTANNIKITNLETQRALDIKDKQIEIDKLAVEKKKNERAFYIAGILLLVLVIIIVSRSNRLQKKTNGLLTIEKKRSDDLLLNILPSEVAEELKNTGQAGARQFDNVTVLFTDFVNFTQAGEQMNPQELISELHNCFKAFDEIITKYKVEKIKTIGDAYLAVAGLPAADENHATHILQAAIEINNFISERTARMGNKTFEIRIGVHSGSVVAGIVGVKKFAYDIWGDTVNTAARMEQNSEPGKINISQTTYELVKDKFTCAYRGEINAKGKGAMKMYYVS